MHTTKFSANPIATHSQPAPQPAPAHAGSSSLHAASAPARMNTSNLPHCDINTDASSASAQKYKLSKAGGRLPEGPNLQLPSQKEVIKATSAPFRALRDTEINATRVGKPVKEGRAETPTERLLKGTKFEAFIDPATGAFRDPSTGLYCELQPVRSDSMYKVTGYALCFPGAGAAGMSSTQMLSSVKQFLGIGGVPKMHSQALELANIIQEKLATEGKTLELTGDSMGGGIANYVGLKLKLPSVCYNAAALGRACLKDIGATELGNLKQQIHIRLKGNFATNPSTTRLLTAFFTLGINTHAPRNIGAIYEIKTSDPNFPRDRYGVDRYALDSLHNWYLQ